MHLVSQRRRSVNRLEQWRPSCRCTRNSTHVSDYNRNSSIENGQINQWTHTLNTYFNAFNTNCIDALSIRCCVTCESDSYSWAKFLNWKRANGSGDRWLEGNECGLMGHELSQWDALGLFVALPMNNKLFVTDMRSMWNADRNQKIRECNGRNRICCSCIDVLCMTSKQYSAWRRLLMISSSKMHFLWIQFTSSLFNRIL